MKKAIQQGFKQILFACIGISIIILGNSCSAENTAADEPLTSEHLKNNWELGSMVTYKNLQVFLIKGATTLSNKKYVTLNNALNKKMVEVIETGNVGELSINNNSGEYVFIHAGDIVKGGRQDRTVRFDMIIEPHAQKTALTSFCVEHDRWQQRGSESSATFTKSENTITSKKLKIAARYKNDQSDVWQNVAKEQEKYNTEISKKCNTAIDVKDNASGSSLQLTLENDSLMKMKSEYKKHFENLLKENAGSIGMVVFINNEISEINIYNNGQLFTDLWDKLIDAAILEAIAEGEKAKTNTESGLDQITTMLNADVKADTSYSEKSNSITKIITTENKKNGVLFFETQDLKANGFWIHYNYLKADAVDFESKQARNYDNTYQIRSSHPIRN